MCQKVLKLFFIDFGEANLHKERAKGTKMVLEKYIKSLNKEDNVSVWSDISRWSFFLTTLIYLQVLLDLLNNQPELSEKAEGILSHAVEWWPILSRPFSQDPIEESIKNDGFRGEKISDLFLPQ